jgi:hypothetical protein
MDRFAMADADVVKVAALPERLEGASRVGQFIQALPGALLLQVPGVGAYLVEHGRSIRFAPQAQSEPDAVAVFLHGAARAALLHQRGDLALHASVVKVPGKAHAIALCGVSGIGKSTLATEMYRRNWTVLADGMARIGLVSGRPVAWPGDHGVKLWRDACVAFGLEVDELEPVRRELQKFYYPIVTAGDPVLLGGVVELSTGEPVLHPVENIVARMSLLTQHTCHPRQIGPLGMLPHHMALVGKTASQVRLMQLGGARQRPVSALGDKIEEASQWMRL